MSLSEEDIRSLELLEQGIFPVREQEYNKLLILIEEVADFLEKAFGVDKKLSKDDFPKFNGTWNSLFEVRDAWSAIKHELGNLGLVGKVTLAVKGFGSLRKLFSAIRIISK